MHVRDPAFEKVARERLWRLGAGALTDAELLGVLLAGGGGPRSAGAFAEGLLATHGGLKALLEQDPHLLAAQPGLGPQRTALMLSALELGRRAQRMVERRPRLRTPREIDGYLRPLLSALRREVFHVLCFNARNVLVRDARIAEGSSSSCPVDPREVFSAALSVRASAVVLAHNHPSGDPEPSSLDVSLTHQLTEGGRMLGIRVMDHLVIGESGYVSMLERGLLPGGGRSPWREAS